MAILVFFAFGLSVIIKIIKKRGDKMAWWKIVLLVLVSISPGIFFFTVIIGLKLSWKWLIRDYPYDDEM